LALFGDIEALLAAAGTAFGTKFFGARLSFFSNCLASTVPAAAVVPAP